jgi:hypothetical protein
MYLSGKIPAGFPEIWRNRGGAIISGTITGDR